MGHRPLQMEMVPSPLARTSTRMILIRSALSLTACCHFQLPTKNLALAETR
jgi:hypothetical protein